MLAGIGILIFLKQIPHAVGDDFDPEGDNQTVNINLIRDTENGSVTIDEFGNYIYWDNQNEVFLDALEDSNPPDNFDQFKVVAPTATAGGTANNVGTAGIMTGEGVYSDATLTVLNSAMNPRIRINYQDLYPTSLSDTTFNASLTDVDYLECTATFAYKRYKIERI